MIISDEEAKKYEEPEEEIPEISNEEFVKAAKAVAKSLRNLRFMQANDFLYELLVTYISSKTNLGKKKVKLVLDTAFEFERKLSNVVIKSEEVDA